MPRVNSEFANEITKYGASDFKACFNCGTCTATCGLTADDANFPRKMIRYSMLGLEEEILSSKELWLCYACGDCSLSCPRQAAPGDLMSALRLYAIAHHEKTGLTRLIFKNNFFSLALTLILSFILGFFLLTIKPEMPVSRWIFQYIPYEVIHSLGIIAFAVMGLSAIVGVWSLWTHQTKNSKASGNKKTFPQIIEAIKKVFSELAAMKRYRDCDSDNSVWSSKPWHVRPWFIHWSVMWGFIGLLVATILDFMLKDPATSYFLPTRLLGTAAGLLMVYGSSIAIYYRWIKITKAYSRTLLADWMFLGFLWLAGITGFWLEISVTLDADLLINHIIFLLHTIISMQLVILFAFSKFAHALYRPVALFSYYLK